MRKWAGVFAIVLSTSSVQAGPAFTIRGLPDFNNDTVAYGISADGSTVVGSSVTDGAFGGAFRWTAAQGMQPLDTNPPNGLTEDPQGAAHAVSANGSVVVGNYTAFGADARGTATRWSLASGQHYIDDNIQAFSELNAVTANGSLAAGAMAGPNGEVAATWSASKGWQPLAGSPAGVAYGMSPDGGTIVGQSSTGAFRYTAHTGLVPLTPDDPLSTARAISADECTIVGDGGGDGFQTTRHAFLWHNGTMTTLNDDPTANTYAYAVSGDGSIVVGNYQTPDQAQPFIWTKTKGFQLLGDLVFADANSGNASLLGWGFQDAYGITPDGRTIVGDGFDPNNSGHAEAYVLTINSRSTGSAVPLPNPLATGSAGLFALAAAARLRRRSTH